MAWIATLSYDKNGDMTSNGTSNYTRNTRNQLTGITGGATASFLYDGLGRRESKTISGTGTNFLYDGLNLEQELNGTTPTVNYLTGADIDETLSRTDSSGTESYLTDNLGSTLALTNSAGAVSTNYAYEPYGNTTVSGSSTNGLQYTGRENDGDGLYFYRARYYSAVYSRFISSDPIGLAGGMNEYSYVYGNPLTLIDPLGLCGCGNFLHNTWNQTVATNNFINHEIGTAFGLLPNGISVPGGATRIIALAAGSQFARSFGGVTPIQWAIEQANIARGVIHPEFGRLVDPSLFTPLSEAAPRMLATSLISGLAINVAWYGGLLVGSAISVGIDCLLYDEN